MNDFAKDTLRTVNNVVRSLESNNATAFEERFANLAHDPDWDFGWVKLLVRYVR